MAADTQREDIQSENVQSENVQPMMLRASISTLANEFEMSRRTVTLRLQEHGVESDDRVRGYPVYRLRDAVPAILAKRHTGSPTAVDDMSPKEKLDHWKAKREKLKYGEEEGRMMQAEDVRVEMAFLVKTVVQAMETLPDILERDCGLDAPTVARVEAEVDSLREVLARRLEEDAV